MEFFIDRDGRVTANDEIVGEFGNETAAARFVMIHCQDNAIDAYTIHYPL